MCMAGAVRDSVMWMAGALRDSLDPLRREHGAGHRGGLVAQWHPGLSSPLLPRPAPLPPLPPDWSLNGIQASGMDWVGLYRQGVH